MKKENLRKLLSFALVLTLAFSFSATVTGADSQAVVYDSECVLEETLTALVKDFGIRFYGTPNEKNATTYVKEQFEKYDSYVSEMVEIPLHIWNHPTGGYLYQNSIQRPAVVEPVDGPWILGRPIPNSATFGKDALGDFSGVFHDFGTFPNISLPDGLTSGGIYGTLRFDNAATVANINTVIAAIHTKYDGAVKLTGLFISRSIDATGLSGGVPVFYSLHGNITNIPVNTVGLALSCLENLAAVGKSGNIKDVYRFEPRVSYAAYATKPAATDEPDLVLVVSAHIDGVWGAPSANDNGSGVTALIELARRFNDVDLGNIELIFAAVGAEEYGSFEGAAYLCERLEREGKITRGATGSNSNGSPGIGVNLNMDMIAPELNAVTSGGASLATVFAGNRSNAQNLASYLLLDEAASVKMPEALDGIITNAMFNLGGASDYMMFHYFGMDATSLNHGLERGYHTAFDNMEDNYSYDRHLYSVDLMTKAIQKAIDQELTKRAKFIAKMDEVTTEVTLTNADQMFKTYDAVAVRFTGKDSGEVCDLTFTKDEPVKLLLGVEELEILSVTATGTGVGNMRTGQAHNFTSRLVGTVDNCYAITSLKINALSIYTVARGESYHFGLILNNHATCEKVEWAIADPSLAYVDHDGNVTIFDKIGNVRLTATDPDTGISHSITLRIAS